MDKTYQDLHICVRSIRGDEGCALALRAVKLKSIVPCAQGFVLIKIESEKGEKTSLLVPQIEGISVHID